MSTRLSKTMAMALVSRTRAGMATKDDTLAQDAGRRRLYEHMGEEGTGGHNQESGETIGPVTHEEGQVT